MDRWAKPPTGEEVKIVTGRNEVGADVFGFLVKRSYRITPAGVCERDHTPPFLPIDIYWSDPEHSSPRLEAELVACKVATDIVVLGHAYAPAHRPTTRCDVAIEIGSARKVITVFGDRVALGDGGSVSFSAPSPLLPCRWSSSVHMAELTIRVIQSGAALSWMLCLTVRCRSRISRILTIC